MAFLFETTDDIEDAAGGYTETEQAVNDEGRSDDGRLKDNGAVLGQCGPVRRCRGVPLVACRSAF